MSLFFLLTASTIVYVLGYFQWRKHWRLTMDANRKEKSGLKRGWNWFSNMVWPFYLLVFATGLWLNNLVIL